MPGEGYCNVKFWWYPEGNYWVLDTDYTSYALVYGCDTWLFGLFYSDQAWILSRTQTLPASKVSAITDLLKYLVPEYPVDKQWEDAKQGGDCKYNAYSP